MRAHDSKTAVFAHATSSQLDARSIRLWGTRFRRQKCHTGLRLLRRTQKDSHSLAPIFDVKVQELLSLGYGLFQTAMDTVSF